ncbi:MAG: hypothetical protein V5A25_09300 [Halovenus sp.]
MYKELIELLLHAVVFLSYAAAGAVVAGLGALFEYRSYLFINNGDTVVALWIGALGLVMLAFAYLIVRDKATESFNEFRVQL